MDDICDMLNSTNIKGLNHHWNTVVRLYSKILRKVPQTQMLSEMTAFETDLVLWIVNNMTPEQIVADSEVSYNLARARKASRAEDTPAYIDYMSEVVKFMYSYGSTM